MLAAASEATQRDQLLATSSLAVAVYTSVRGFGAGIDFSSWHDDADFAPGRGGISSYKLFDMVRSVRCFQRLRCPGLGAARPWML